MQNRYYKKTERNMFSMYTIRLAFSAMINASKIPAQI